MIYIYGLSRPLLVAFVAILTIATALQTVRLLIASINSKNWIDWLDVFYEMFIGYYFVMTILIISVSILQRGLFANYFYSYRHFYLVPALIGLLLFSLQRKNFYLSSSIALLLNTPMFEMDLSVYLFPTTCLFLVLRSIVLLDYQWGEVRNSITRISIVQAVDSYQGGILYAKSSGKALIINPSMNRLLDQMKISLRADVFRLWESIQHLENSYDLTVSHLEDKLMVRLRNYGSWLFSIEKIRGGRRDYIQLLAIDVTDEDILMKETEETNKTLEELGTKLITAIESIDTIQRKKEILRLKSRVHDVLAQRLSILSRILDTDEDPYVVLDKIEPLLHDLSSSITEPLDTSPEYLLKSIINSFTLIGTKLHIEDSLPSNAKIADLFAGIIRESSTNAIRHGNANNIFANIKDDDFSYSLFISNDGDIPELPIKEGGGLSGIRSQVEDLGGDLVLAIASTFNVKVEIPKNKDGDLE